MYLYITDHHLNQTHSQFNLQIKLVKMQVLIGLIFSTVLLSCVGSSPVSQEQPKLNIFDAELQFFNSLTPEQRGWWVKIRDKITGVLTAGIFKPSIGILIPQTVHVTEDVIEELKAFVNSLNSEQRGWWSKIRETWISGISKPGKRDVNDDVADEVEAFVDSLTPEQRGWWTKIRDTIRDKVIETAITTAIVTVLDKK